MNNYTISLNDNLNDFVKKAVTEGGHANINEYICELLKNSRLKKLPKVLSDIEKLKLFNKKAERLEQYKIWQFLEENTPSWTRSSGLTSNNYPDDELIEAPCITLRLFMQDNDHISIRNMAKIYDNNPYIPNELKTAFVESRNTFNNFLDKNSLFSVQSMIWISESERATTNYTNREIFEALLYGEIAHFTQMEDYQSLYQGNFRKNFNLMQVFSIMQEFKNFIIIVKQLNQRSVPHIKV